MPTIRLSGAILALVLFFSPIRALAHDPHSHHSEPVIQIAILLDTSNSMDGLIGQAKSQLWKIVNEFGCARRDGHVPRLEVALYEYGNNNLQAGEGYVRMVLPLTGDLDKVSEKLFALTTNGGDEYCGQVIQSAVHGLAWSTDPGTYKAIFIAGNEPFTQGQVDYRRSCAAAIGRGIVVNTIHCGDRHSGESGQWDDGARLGEGKFMNINQDRAIVAVPTPCDAAIERLSVELNMTYIPYGAAGMQGQLRQEAQDANAAAERHRGAAIGRGLSKASSLYRNETWDLVDAQKEGVVTLESVEAEELPENMQSMTLNERKQYVEEQASRRAEIQTKIQDLNAQREKYLAEHAQEASAGDTFDQAVITAVREQLVEKSFEVDVNE